MNKYFLGERYQKGYGIGGRKNQRGRGLGNLFSKFFKWMTPFAQKTKDITVPILKSGAKMVGKQLIQTTSNIAKDLIMGKNAKASLKKGVAGTVDNFNKSLPILKSGAKEIGNELVNTTSRIANDLVDGRNVDLTNRIDNSLDSIDNIVKTKLQGSGHINRRQKRKRNNQKNNFNKKKKRILDIFD